MQFHEDDDDSVAITKTSAWKELSLDPVPTMLEVLVRNTDWRTIYRKSDGMAQSMLEENAIDKFNADSIEVVHRLDYAAYAPKFIAEKTGLTVERVEAIVKQIDAERENVIKRSQE